tara:strand:+ start:805 stop:999 length:195 start_codon:yes stop_codon:yes gene_type:complete
MAAGPFNPVEIAQIVEDTLSVALEDHPLLSDRTSEVLCHAREDGATDIRIVIDGREYLLAVVAV